MILPLDSPEATLEQVGGKGASLARLASAGLPVPPGFHLTTPAYRRFVSQNDLAGAILSAAAEANPGEPATLDRASAQIRALMEAAPIPEELAGAVRQGYAALGDDDPPVAVRSSATAEDLPELSFAGQQETYLNVRGGDRVLEAVRRCWASLWTARAIGYRARQGIPPAEVSLAVVVQQLIPADAAGILFTANPLTGARDEIVINAAWGLGEAIVGGLVTPDTLVLRKETGEVISQEVANKVLMTAPSPEGTREEPVPAGQRMQAALSSQQAAGLARLGARIEALYGRPMDIEWARRGESLFILQARPITALPEPRPSLDWQLPRPNGRYARSSVIELLPDPLSPLFATLALPVWNDAIRYLAKILGPGRALAEHVRLVTINDYAYYDTDMGGWQGARLLLALVWGMPNILRMLRRAQARWAGEARPRYAAVVQAWAERDLAATPAEPLLDGARAIVNAAAEHYLTIQSGILPVAYMSESVFTVAYQRLIRRKGDPPALTFLLGFESAPIRAEKSLYDLAMWARGEPELAAYLGSATSAEIAAAYQSSSAPESPGAPAPASWGEFCRRLSQHLERFGHTIYDLDFAKALPADDPAPLLEALKYFLTGQARSPHDRQAAAAAAREQAMESLLARRKGIRRWLFERLVRSAQRYAPLREDALADVGLGWPLLRRIFREIGQRLAARGGIAQRDDLFWLEWEEVQTAAHALAAPLRGGAPAAGGSGLPGGGESVRDYRPVVAERRARWERERAVTPPVVLPARGDLRFLGIDFTRWLPARTDQAAGDTIRGIGASPGRVSGLARVLRGPEEFSEMRAGEILVAKITTPAWTPLFALAAGVVTDVGGPLSHSSIVAREYHIPAVLGTGVATERLRSGQRITVDGDSGVVTVEK